MILIYLDWLTELIFAGIIFSQDFLIRNFVLNFFIFKDEVLQAGLPATFPLKFAE